MHSPLRYSTKRHKTGFMKLSCSCSSCLKDRRKCKDLNRQPCTQALVFTLYMYISPLNISDTQGKKKVVFLLKDLHQHWGIDLARLVARKHLNRLTTLGLEILPVALNTSYALYISALFVQQTHKLWRVLLQTAAWQWLLLLNSVHALYLWDQSLITFTQRNVRFYPAMKQ